MALRLRLRRDVVCQQAVELVTDYLEDGLSRRDRRRFESHLAGCPHCTEYLAQMRATITLTGSITPEDLTPGMRSEFIDLYRRFQAGGGPDTRPDAGAGPRQDPDT
jgi:predicted anti-sigma-YlaC factor YlaD